MLTTCTMQIHHLFFFFSYLWVLLNCVLFCTRNYYHALQFKMCRCIYNCCSFVFSSLRSHFYGVFMLPLCSYCFVDPVLWDNSIPRNLLSATYYIQHAGEGTVCITLYILCFCVLYYYYYYTFFVYFCVLFFFFCVFYSSNLTSCHAANYGV